VDLPGPLQDIEVLNPIRVGETPDEKNVMLDVLARVPGYGRVNIEMQRTRQVAARERFLYYWAREYGRQLVRGDDYALLVPVISILWFDFVLARNTPFHSVYTLREAVTGEPYSPHQQIHTLELPKLTTNFTPQTLRNWGYFFAGAPLQRAEAAKRDTMIGRAMDKLQKLSDDEMVRFYAEKRERDELHIRNSIAREVAEARREALNEGRQEGRDAARREVFARLLHARFGALSESVQAKLNQADQNALTQIEQRIFTATSLDDLLSTDDSKA
jgi:predicted transposase/invertase (TIGR01784 family)